MFYALSRTALKRCVFFDTIKKRDSFVSAHPIFENASFQRCQRVMINEVLKSDRTQTFADLRRMRASELTELYKKALGY